MNQGSEKRKSDLSLEERRIRIEEARLTLEHSFAKKWLPIIATVTMGIIAAIFGFVQHLNSIDETERVRIDAKAKDDREWGIKVAELYLTKHELFDFSSRNPDAAARNLRVLSAVAPTVVQGVLKAEQSRIPGPTGQNDEARIKSLAAVEGVRDALASAAVSTSSPETTFKPVNFTVYIQYGSDKQTVATQAQRKLFNLGYHVPEIEKVKEAPYSLEVRYYRPEQVAFAGRLTGELEKELNLPPGSGKAVMIESHRKLPGGILEVWLPR